MFTLNLVGNTYYFLLANHTSFVLWAIYSNIYLEQTNIINLIYLHCCWLKCIVLKKKKLSSRHYSASPVYVHQNLS